MSWHQKRIECVSYGNVFSTENVYEHICGRMCQSAGVRVCALFLDEGRGHEEKFRIIAAPASPPPETRGHGLRLTMSKQ
jgi:hypothetical protein